MKLTFNLFDFTQKVDYKKEVLAGLTVAMTMIPESLSFAILAEFPPLVGLYAAFIAGLIPLVKATGAGAIGNRTIGTAALGGMLFGTIFGVLLIPGLYYIFAKLAEGRKMIKNEDFTPLTEDYNYLDSHKEKNEKK